MPVRFRHDLLACLLQRKLLRSHSSLKKLLPAWLLRLTEQLRRRTEFMMRFEDFLADRIQGFRRDNFVDDTFRASLKPSKLPPGKNERQGINQTDLSRQPHRSTPAWQQTKLHFGESEFRFFMRAGNSILAGECELQAAAQTRAGDQSDRRDLQVFEFLKDALTER